MNWILQRLCEKTTWLGLVTIVTSLGVVMSPDLAAAITSAGVAIGGVILVITREKK